MNSRRISQKSILLFAISLLTLLISGTVIYSIEQFKRLRDITLVVLFALQLLLIMKTLKTTVRLKKSLGLIAAGALVFFGVSVFVHPSSAFNFFSKVLMFMLFCMLFYDQQNARRLLRYLYNLVVAISVVGLFFFVALYILKLPLPFTQLNNGFFRSYLYLFYDVEAYRETIGPFVYYRLQSVFWEPGVFGIYLILSLFYYAFLDEEKDKRKLYILLICLFLTSSTTGTILGLFVIAVFLIRKIKKQRIRLFVIIPSAILTAIAAYYLLMAKKNGGGGYSASYILRMVDLNSSLTIWKQHFLFGTGYNNVNEFEKLTSIWQRQNSNGFMNWCMTMGLWGLIVQMLPLIVNVLKSRKRQRLIHIVFAIVYIGINMTEPLITSPLMIMLLSLDYVVMVKQTRGGRIHGFEREKISVGVS